MTATYNYLGYGVTDSNGKAKLEYDAQGNSLTHSYTGTGAGKVDIVASLDDEITESSLVSETYELIDALFYDSGTTGTVDTRWKSVNTGQGTATSTSEGTTFANGDTNRYDMFIKDSSNNIFIWNAPFCVEVDITEIVGNASRLQIYSAQTNEAYNGGSSIGHWKIEYDGTTVRPYRDGTALSTYERNMSNARVGFYIVSGGSITFKNFKIYPI